MKLFKLNWQIESFSFQQTKKEDKKEMKFLEHELKCRISLLNYQLTQNNEEIEELTRIPDESVDINLLIKTLLLLKDIFTQERN